MEKYIIEYLTREPLDEEDNLLCPVCGQPLSMECVDIYDPNPIDYEVICPNCHNEITASMDPWAEEVEPFEPFGIELCADYENQNIIVDICSAYMNTDIYLLEGRLVPEFVILKEDALKNFKDWLDQNEIISSYCVNNEGYFLQAHDDKTWYTTRGKDPILAAYVLFRRIQCNMDDDLCNDIFCPMLHDYETRYPMQDTQLHKKLMQYELLAL